MKIRKNNKSLRYLLEFWSHYCKLDTFHETWLREHAEVRDTQKGQLLYDKNISQLNVYFVCSGLLARIEIDPITEKRKIHTLAMPGMAMMTTIHLYSSTPSSEQIVSLQSSRVICIPYKVWKELKEQEPCIDTLIDVLINKKKKQLVLLRKVTHSTNPFERYLLLRN